MISMAFGGCLSTELTPSARCRRIAGMWMPTTIPIPMRRAKCIPVKAVSFTTLICLMPSFSAFRRAKPTAMDPQQRLLLEVSWQALEHAAIDPHTLRNSLTGIFVGISTSEYLQIGLKQSDPGWIDAYTGTGGALSVAAGRLAYFLKSRGPAISLDTACSSSLVAIDLAVQHLRSQKCRLALAGGVNLTAVTGVYGLPVQGPSAFTKRPLQDLRSSGRRLRPRRRAVG